MTVTLLLFRYMYYSLYFVDIFVMHQTWKKIEKLKMKLHVLPPYSIFAYYDQM